MTLEYLKQNWVSHEDPDLQKTMWDRAAVNYKKKPVPDFETNSFLQFMEEHVPLHEIRSSLDIGCGAGAYSLALASRIDHVTGVDISPAMISAANGQAEKMGLSNASFSCVNWSSTDIDAAGYRSAFDLVFAHMTPAISSYDTFHKMVSCSRRYCILQSNTRRRDRILDRTLKLMGIDSSQVFRDDEISFCFDYLWLNGYEPQIFYHQEVWTPVRTLENSLHWCLDRARLHQEITPEQEQIAGEYLESQAVDGMVQEHVDTTIVTMFWEMI